ncbi:transmembrane protein 222 isoform X2 [Plutella xylostella]|nr:transmembrane protein 222 isoform X2 [Plutella xylostella]
MSTNTGRSSISPPSSSPDEEVMIQQIDPDRSRFPFCIVWTPIPVLTWIFPFLGHMGICMSNGVIRDFAGPYFVSEDLMAFGNPTKYWQLSAHKASGGVDGWNSAVYEASQIYKKRMHILFYDNCHSHVAMALNLMNYDGCKNWNMVKLAFYMLLKSRYVSFWGFLKTWLPFFIIVAFIFILAAVLSKGTQNIVQ